MNTHEETLKIARELIKKDPSLTDWVISKFPELQESEDERIRKALIDFFSRGAENGEQTNGIRDKDILAWLEKQGKSAFEAVEEENEIRPKFKEDDWITTGDYTWKVIKVKSSEYTLQSQDGDIVDDTISFVDEQFHLWTIQDAKDGDILVTIDNKRAFLYKGLLDSNHPESPVAYCGIDSEECFTISGRNHWWTDEKVCPATKEQYTLLFQIMKEEGYEWDAKKKELKYVGRKAVEWVEE